MTSPKLQASLQSGPHHLLNQLCGHWKGHAKTWFEGDEPVDESPMEGNIRSLFDGRFILHEYKGSFQGQPFEGIVIFGYHLMSQSYQAAWIDTFHTGTAIMFSEGAKEGVPLGVLGSYLASAESGERWGWRTSMELRDSGALVITAYNIAPDGRESKATETVYHRAGLE